MLLLICVFPWLAEAAAGPIDQTGRSNQLQAASGQQRVEITSVLIDPEAPKTTQQRLPAVVQTGNWLAFSEAPDLVNRIGGSFWFHSRIEWDQPLPTARLLTIDWWYFEHLAVYICRDGCDGEAPTRLPATGRFGTTIPYVFELAPAGSRSVDIYMQLTSGAKLVMPLTVWTEHEFLEHNSQRLLVLGAMLGIMVVMMLYNAILAGYLRDPVYAIYVLYILSVIIYSLSMSGLGHAWIWGNASWSMGRLIGPASSVAFALPLLFFYRLLNVASWPGLTPVICRAMLVIWVLLFVALLLLDPGMATEVEDVMALVSFPLLLGIALRAWISGNRIGMYLFIGWLLVNSAGALVMLSLSGVIDWNNWYLALQILGFTVELLVFSVALAERIHRERQERDHAQQMSLQYLQEAALARDLAYQVERDAKLRLEDEVSARTSELQEAMLTLEELNEQLDYRSKHDSLTGLANRRYFDTCLSECWSELRAGESLCVIMGDIDHFKLLNDNYGHPAGDYCLVEVAQLWQRWLAQHARLVARYGGEEFIAIVVGRDEDFCNGLAEQLRSAIESARYRYDGQTIHITCSLGLASSAQHPQGVVDILKAADDALYAAKTGGRNQVRRAA
ncbi:diguanylate cyclase [Oceanobacter mangrovi]|uniref:diguanylate cyclase n=1 Tax=Oceanobacter mangrovi TaxID=2862510 RepID=UPI001C8E82C6|nr:diguanylate cyclase [Oceanobacter mangrovi]